MQGSNGDTDIDGRIVGTVGARASGVNGERAAWEHYIVLCVDRQLLEICSMTQ